MHASYETINRTWPTKETYSLVHVTEDHEARDVTKCGKPSQCNLWLLLAFLPIPEQDAL
jgi:hypothetical protein